jgi:hypothetical protein
MLKNNGSIVLMIELTKVSREFSFSGFRAGHYCLFDYIYALFTAQSIGD